MYRIPGQASEEAGNQPKPAVLLQHGIDCDMMMWIFNSPDKANAFILSRAGYDVWIGNNRGTTYGMRHQSLDPKERPFWNFYQEDMARKDLPAFIDFILETTGLETISYIGHSQGTTQFMLGASLEPDYYTPKINIAILMAPVALPANVCGVVNRTAYYIDEIVDLVVDIGKHYNWIPYSPNTAESID